MRQLTSLDAQDLGVQFLGVQSPRTFGHGQAARTREWAGVTPGTDADVSWLAYLISLVVVGLIVGALARLALPGRDPMSIPATIGVGILGSLIGGLVTYAVTDGRNAGGWIVSLVFATLIVYLIRRSRGGGLTDPGRGNSPGRFGSRRR
jgi:uncharacterized membrane protein YeaQ/YmgE (transglycosylase-associated protein family)